MVVIGCPLNEAYNNINKKKKKSLVDVPKHIDEDTGVMDDFFKVTGLQGYVSESDYINKNVMGIGERSLAKDSDKNKEIQSITKDNIAKDNIDKDNIDKEKILSNNYERQQKIAVDYDEYINYEIYKRNMENNNHKIIEGFGNVKDDFNEVLLFALLGIFFIIFTDYIYKLGKKSY